jgi:hypothetical protein
MGAVPGLRATIQMLPSDVEAHFDDPKDMIIPFLGLIRTTNPSADCSKARWRNLIRVIATAQPGQPVLGNKPSQLHPGRDAVHIDC